MVSEETIGSAILQQSAPCVFHKEAGNVRKLLRKTVGGCHSQKTARARQANVEKPFDETGRSRRHLVRVDEKDGFKFQALNELNAEDADFCLGSEDSTIKASLGLNPIRL